MKDNIKLSPAKEKEVEEILKRFHEEQKKGGPISDEDFMAEFEVSDEEYKLGLVLPGIGNEEKE
jgi:hypothetical protein